MECGVTAMPRVPRMEWIIYRYIFE
jgi:hypothetical protein